VLRALLPECMTRQRHPLSLRLENLVRQRNRAPDAIERLGREIIQSQQMAIQRKGNAPKPKYPPDLPVVQRRDDIAAAIAANQVIVLCGETGSGKTTQLPKICLELGRGSRGMIGHTQPRRIAARTVSQRIASELETSLGQVVGYKVRFGDKTSPDTYIKLMTDGILLAETQSDRYLENYDTIIIDEAHERSLNIDFLLGYIKQLLPKRPDLKVIITSATIDPQRFSKHFNDCPIVEVSGRMYPVETRYRPAMQFEEAITEEAPPEPEPDYDPLRHLLDAVNEVLHEEAGDTLIFLPGEREIREATDFLRENISQDVELLPLYARLNTQEQQKIFAPHQRRRIVLATNVAETSLTVPGIRYVIDPGFARLSRYSTRQKVQRLHIEPISQASANQRAGRCGRVAPGVCLRLYSPEDFANRPEFTEPEILRTNLAAVILQMKALNLGDPLAFPFLEPPEWRQIRDGYNTLRELGAVDDEDRLTPLGRNLARLPTDPRVGRMILEAEREDVLPEVLIIAAGLTVPDVRDRPMDRQQQADEKHRQFVDESSDFLTYLNIFKAYHEKARNVGGSQLRRWCRENFLSYVRIREWLEVHRQLRSLVAELRLDQRTRGRRGR